MAPSLTPSARTRGAPHCSEHLCSSIVFGLVQIYSLVAPLRAGGGGGGGTCAERMCCLACSRPGQLPHISPGLSVMLQTGT